MKIRTLVLALAALSATAALATSPPTADRPLNLALVVAHMESRYPGEVVAIELDASGDKAAHYHVDMRFADSGLARVDVDAATLEIAAREPAPLSRGAATLAEATALATASFPGHVTAAELDSTHGVAPHYDIDVRLPNRHVARLKVDPATRQIAWRVPAIVAE
jgi:uncharacterized membrane protein YkoI